ncbi:MAG: tetratricopeptide repeat protein [Verrucomicrobia bacterium]|nr:tetratricopeptide repeat protein [Verrucomicrobiota bacterium]
MTDWPAVLRLLAAVCVCLGWAGCSPLGQNTPDEQKESYFLVGKSRAGNLDYQGAADAFEKALEVNPRNASAHYELGLLYELHLTNYPAAIYHYQRLLKLRPGSDRAEIVRPRITACEQELAKTVSLGPITPAMQRDLERLAEENQRLRQQVDYLSRRLTMLTNVPPGPLGTISVSATTNPPAGRSTALTNRLLLAATDAPAPGAASRTYVVKPHDTLSAIARKHGVKLAALRAANPRLDPRRLRIGESLVVPSPAGP